eukprot:CAMPEP_0183470628 /NCGR_PEP_ID=MMETSP0370-20130417/156627_1 /TAXON_ID=268820 /ORGANISM="Peridinium aciculiferum, Strain PAER-2" /LENGTH=78 /DNA_ID=CAMNT_0025663165 /DNA_START=8 /DNA_END=244 /DNA_ORIENTATION=+
MTCVSCCRTQANATSIAYTGSNQAQPPVTKTDDAWSWSCWVGLRARIDRIIFWKTRMSGIRTDVRKPRQGEERECIDC